MSNELCTCGHLWADHYDCSYCLHEECCCGPCTECGAQFVEVPVNQGICPKCKVELNSNSEKTCD